MTGISFGEAVSTISWCNSAIRGWRFLGVIANKIDKKVTVDDQRKQSIQEDWICTIGRFIGSASLLRILDSIKRFGIVMYNQHNNFNIALLGLYSVGVNAALLIGTLSVVALGCSVTLEARSRRFHHQELERMTILKNIDSSYQAIKLLYDTTKLAHHITRETRNLLIDDSISSNIMRQREIL